MKKISILASIVIIAGIAIYLLFFKEPVFRAKGGYLTNIDAKGVILGGYDPVAYFTDSRPVKGSSRFSFEYDGAVYWFASGEHLDKFKNAPQKFTPQYGSFCGYAVSIGKLRPVDPTIFQIENGRLILQHTKEAYDLFNQDLKANIAMADHNWPDIVADHVGKPVKYDKQAPPPTASTSSSQ